MTTRERVRAILDFKPVDRLPVIEWAPWWTQTIDRWRGEGLPVEATDCYDICRHFGLDMLKYRHFGARGPGCPQPAGHGHGIIASSADYERIRPCLYPDVVDAALWTTWAAEQARGDTALWFNIDGFFWWRSTR